MFDNFCNGRSFASFVLATFVFVMASISNVVAQQGYLSQGDLSKDIDDKIWWNQAVADRLHKSTRAGNPVPEIHKALATVAIQHRAALQFLVQHMPEADLHSLDSDFLLQNIRLAYQARDQVAWGKDVPEQVFFNDVLPYANVDETRENWRPEMMERCLEIIKDCQTPGQAALKLNRELFPLINVRYARSREKANQSPSESIRQSVASCTGLSIILADACRSVCVPCRLTGTPSWTNKRGNHTWVEVWDQGRWHFTGAAEPSDEFNKTWFNNDAAAADNSKPRNRIYAVSFARTGLYFPMVWSNSKNVPAINVTDQYTADRQEPDARQCQVLINVFNSYGSRIRAEIKVVDDANGQEIVGMTRDETVDTNDILTMELQKNRAYTIHLRWNDHSKTIPLRTLSGSHQSVPIRLD